ncbi:MAG: type IV secretion protein Rhs, partial [Chthoniobacterales bacterium]
GITIQAAAKVILKAAEIDLNASLLNVDAAVAKFSGVVQCDTLISNSVVSASYTPGAGNLM